MCGAGEAKASYGSPVTNPGGTGRPPLSCPTETARPEDTLLEFQVPAPVGGDSPADAWRKDRC
ncbi:hypothetical protein MANY_20550 [Mycolicibacterium anyangense]|uniref:Uncharacterized protein n=1 Tax=Mycolicibacterium anyangense TaxID=1431246 RepID=A0A6N4W864_9MYCO|nr:hypothetical protein MANY_20550 [Mycolicibacterium anyangense]